MKDFAIDDQTAAGLVPSFCNRSEVEEQFPAGSWQRVVFAEFGATVDNPNRAFPCTFAIQGFRQDQLRYLFLDDPINVPNLACSLARYLVSARQAGPNTSLVAFTRPGPVCPIDHYRRLFWSILDQLHRIDGQPWPHRIPSSMDHPEWEFCFAGEAVFVVCNTPAHAARQSRRSSSFMMTFQPRWVFDKSLQTQKAAEAVFGNIRERIKRYDCIPPSSDLGHYGDPDNREFRQYVLDDDNGGAEFAHSNDNHREGA
jgi:FPC/CPF motif-containing protein YcgG